MRTIGARHTPQTLSRVRIDNDARSYNRDNKLVYRSTIAQIPLYYLLVHSQLPRYTHFVAAVLVLRIAKARQTTKKPAERQWTKQTQAVKSALSSRACWGGYWGGCRARRWARQEQDPNGTNQCGTLEKETTRAIETGSVCQPKLENDSGTRGVESRRHIN